MSNINFEFRKGIFFIRFIDEIKEEAVDATSDIDDKYDTAEDKIDALTSNETKALVKTEKDGVFKSTADTTNEPAHLYMVIDDKIVELKGVKSIDKNGTCTTIDNKKISLENAKKNTVEVSAQDIIDYNKTVQNVNEYLKKGTLIQCAGTGMPAGMKLYKSKGRPENSAYPQYFVVKDGKLIFASFDRQYYDRKSANPFTPAAMCYPSDFPEAVQKTIRNDLQRLVTLLGITTTIINVECRLGIDGKPYIMELSPRAGGNRVPEIVRYASGVDIVMNNVKCALGMPVDDMKDPVYDGSYARVVLHAFNNGKFKGVKIDNDVEKKYLVEKDIWVRPGDYVETFTGANKSIGLLFVHFPNITIADDYLRRINEWVHVEVE